MNAAEAERNGQKMLEGGERLFRAGGREGGGGGWRGGGGEGDLQNPIPPHLWHPRDKNENSARHCSGGGKGDNPRKRGTGLLSHIPSTKIGSNTFSSGQRGITFNKRAWRAQWRREFLICRANAKI